MTIHEKIELLQLKLDLLKTKRDTPEREESMNFKSTVEVQELKKMYMIV
ncbi:MAG: hypothetical protein GY756_15435 [bacterium]|nr:hypothetical protein [bacterium]